MTRKFDEEEFKRICLNEHVYFETIETIEHDGDMHSRCISLVVKDLRNDKHYSCCYQKSFGGYENEYWDTTLEEIKETEEFDKKLDQVMDSEYFRYLMKKRNTDSKKLASYLGLSQSQINYKILRGSFSLKDIYAILKTFDMKFEDVFIRGEEE